MWLEKPGKTLTVHPWRFSSGKSSKIIEDNQRFSSDGADRRVCYVGRSSLFIP
jgi:hypothetical protein